ncbi:hypothetical protein [Paraburkholderia strydomiana]|uniref:hypothetical protein n=1 Tax=Paraburkholderia strydomiana TaxID=1245417 RepID=UPI001BED14AA|nr:hypothetical protein [Paraburkholderia strydomiana]MBT2794270.1 hypothetical protein [Paraburkholderia strydomiana]
MPIHHSSLDPHAAAGAIAKSHFRLTRRAFRLALVVVVTAPCIFLTLLGWQDRLQAARETAERATYVGEEHAEKIFDIDAVLAERVLDTLRTHADVALASHSRNRPLYEFLEQLVHGYGQVDALSVWTAGGRLLATSISYPTPNLSIADRLDFVDDRNKQLASSPA